MKNKNFNNNTFTKKWFYLAIAFGLFFALITTFIAIGRNMSYSKKQNKGIPAQAEKTDLKKEPSKEPSFDKQIYSYTSSSSYSSSSSSNTSSSSSSKTSSSSSNSSSSSAKALTDSIKSENKSKSSNEIKIEKDKEASDDEKIKPTQAIKKDVPKETKKFNAKFFTPVKGEILRPFSKEELVHWACLNDWRTHDGVDIEALKNTPVKAVADGTVTDIKDNKGTWGNCVTITHSDGKFKSIYKGLSNAINVKLEQTVKAGDVIGTLGETNKIECDLKNHLHFGLKRQEQQEQKDEWVWVDPQDYIDFK